MQRLNLFLFLFCLLFVANVSAQQRMFVIHEDQVIPTMADEYEAVAKKFTALLDEAGVDAQMNAMMTNDFRYYWISEVKNMSDLDNNPMAPVAEAHPKKYAALMSEFDDCYHQHGDYMVVLDEELSYMPEETDVDVSTPGMNYRKYWYHWVDAGDEDKMYDLAKRIKAMHKENGSEMYYRMYREGFGQMGPLFLVVSSGESPVEHAMRAQTTMEKLGDDYSKLIQEVVDLTIEFEELSGWMRPDLSYSGGM